MLGSAQQNQGLYKNVEGTWGARHRGENIDCDRLSLWLIYVAAAAQKFMGDLQLDPDREAHMRKTAIETIKEAADSLTFSQVKGNGD